MLSTFKDTQQKPNQTKKRRAEASRRENACVTAYLYSCSVRPFVKTPLFSSATSRRYSTLNRRTCADKHSCTRRMLAASTRDSTTPTSNSVANCAACRVLLCPPTYLWYQGTTRVLHSSPRISSVQHQQVPPTRQPSKRSTPCQPANLTSTQHNTDKDWRLL